MATCINRSTKEFKRVAEALKSPILANAAIVSWQEANNDDSIPNVRQINNFVENANIKYNLNKREFADSLLANLTKKGILTKFKGNFYIVQSRGWKYDPGVREYNLKRLRGYLNANNIPLNSVNTFVKGKGLAVQVNTDLFTPQDIIPASRSFNTTHTRKIINHLKQLFPDITVQLTTEEKAKEYYDGLPEEQKADVKFEDINSFYVNGTAILIEGRIKDDTAIEEVLHPFIEALYLYNNKLFTGLFNDSKKEFPDLWQGIQNAYSDEKGFNEKHRELELVTQALSRYFNKEYAENPTVTFRERIKEFLDWFAGIVEDLYKYLTQKKLFKGRIPIDTTTQKIEKSEADIVYDTEGDKNGLNKIGTKEDYLNYLNSTLTFSQILVHNTVKPFEEFDIDLTTMLSTDLGKGLYVSDIKNSNQWKNYQQQNRRAAESNREIKETINYLAENIGLSEESKKEFFREQLRKRKDNLLQKLRNENPNISEQELKNKSMEIMINDPTYEYNSITVIEDTLNSKDADIQGTQQEINRIKELISKYKRAQEIEVLDESIQQYYGYTGKESPVQVDEMHIEGIEGETDASFVMKGEEGDVREAILRDKKDYIRLGSKEDVQGFKEFMSQTERPIKRDLEYFRGDEALLEQEEREARLDVQQPITEVIESTPTLPVIMEDINIKDIKDGLLELELPIKISKSGLDIINELKDLGHDSLIVGGAVRDSLMGFDPKDIDIEVYGIAFDELAKVLDKHGKVDIVGKEFGVIKFKDNVGNEYDFSVPRRENKVGIGHKDFKVTVDPNMTAKDAAERRDFSWNALAYNPTTGVIHDYYSGIKDLKSGVLRHTSEQFSEDPLRILRALQFQSRGGFKLDPLTKKLMNQMVKEGAMTNLSVERVTEEWMKWATKGKNPALLFGFLRETGLMPNFGDLYKMVNTEQDAEWHPEGNVEIHTGQVMDAAVKIAEREGLIGDDRAVLLFSALLHDIAKPATTITETEGKKKGRITSAGHEAMGGPMAREILEGLGIKKDIVNKVVVLIENHLQHVSVANEKINPQKAARTLAKKLAKGGTNIQMLLYLIESDVSGRAPLAKGLGESGEILKELAKDIGIVEKPKDDILLGRHLIEMGIKPGVEMGEILKDARLAQDEGLFNDLAGAKEWANSIGLRDQMQLTVDIFPETATLSDIAKLLNTSDIQFELDVKADVIDNKVRYNLSPGKEKVYQHVKGQSNAIQKGLLDKFFFAARKINKEVKSLSLSTEEDAPIVVLDKATHTYTDLNDLTKTYKSTTEAIKGKMSPEKQKEYDFNMQLGNDFDGLLDGLAANVSKKDITKEMQILKGQEFEDAYVAMQAQLALLTQDQAIAIPQVVVYDKATGLAGTIDLLIITKEGSVRIVDLKTSKRSIKDKNMLRETKYESSEWNLDEGSILKENGVSKLSTKGQHGLQVLTYARMLQNMGYTLASYNPVSTIHLKVNVAGKGTKQKYKGTFVYEGAVHHKSVDNPYIDLLVPLNVDLQQAKKIKETVSNKEDSFYDAKNNLTPEEALPDGSKIDVHYEVVTQALKNYQAGLVKKQKALEQIKSSVFLGKNNTRAQSKEQVLSAISAVSIALTLGPKERAAVFSSLLMDAVKQMREFEEYVQDPKNFGKPEYISYVLNFDRFLSTFEGLYLIQNLDGVNATQQKLITQLQIKANLIAGTGSGNNYKEGLIDQAIYDYVRNVVKTKSNRNFTEDQLDDLMNMADDIHLADLTAMDRATSSDTILALMDKIFKAKRQEFHDRVQERESLIMTPAQKLLELSKEKDPQKLYDWMLEFDENGEFTSRYVKELGQVYYDEMERLRTGLFDENGSPIEYIEINDLSTADSKDIEFNIELAKKKELYSAFWRAETVGANGLEQAGEYHYYTKEFKDERDKYMYFIDNGYHGKWIRKDGISDKIFNRFQAKYYDIAALDQFVVPKRDQNGQFTGATLTGLMNPTVKREYRKARLDTSKGKNMRSEKYKAIYADKSALGLARREFYEMFRDQFENQLLTKLPKAQRDQMLGRVPLQRGKVAQDLRGKGNLFNKLYSKTTKGLKYLFTETQTQKTLFTDESGDLVDALPIFYTGRPQDTKQLEIIDAKISMLEQERREGKMLAPQYKKKMALLKGERSKIEHKPTLGEINRDMGNGLLKFAAMAQHYETMGTVEDTMKAMLKTIEKRTYQKSSISITGIKTKFGFVEKGSIKGIESNLYKKAKKFMNMVYYDNDSITKGGFEKMADGLIKYSSLSYVAFNPFGNFNNYVLGRVMDNIEAVGGRFYSKDAFLRASKEFNKRALPDVMKRVSHGDYWPTNKADYNPHLPNSKYEAFVDIFRMMDSKADIRESGSDLEVVQKSYFSRFLDWGYVMQDAAEYNVQTKVGMAMIMDTYIRNNETGEIKSLYDAFTFNPETKGATLEKGFTTIVEIDKKNLDENGNPQAIREKGEYNNEFRYELRNKIREVNKQIHGNYAEEDRAIMQAHSLGKLVMQFHKWMVPGFNARFQSEYFDENLGWMEGRYRSFWKFVGHASKQAYEGNLKFNEYSKSFLEDYGYKEGGDAQQNQKALNKLQGYYRTLGEIAFTMLSFATYSLMMAAFSGGDDDDNELITKLQNILMYQADRTGRELLVFMPFFGSVEQMQFIKSPIASTRTIGELGQAFWSTVTTPFAYFTKDGDEFYADKDYVYQRGSRKGQLKVKKEWMDAIPVLYSIKKWDNYATMKNFFIK